jgi:hypothetical protein
MRLHSPSSGFLSDLLGTDPKTFRVHLHDAEIPLSSFDAVRLYRAFN